MTEDEYKVFNWFSANTPKMVDFYCTLHIHNLASMYAKAVEYERHMLIPDNWPIESQWSFELLAASILGACNNPEKKKELTEWFSFS